MRLTTYIRDQAISNLMANRFDKEQKAIKKEELELGEFAYNTFFGEHKRRMNGLPKGWLPRRSYFETYVAGERHQFRLKEERSFPYDIHSNDRRLHMTCLLTTKMKEHQQRKIKFIDDKATARAQAHSVLNSVSTVEKLLKVWPEVKPFLPKVEGIVTTALALPIASLNTMLGLGKS